MKKTIRYTFLLFLVLTAATSFAQKKGQNQPSAFEIVLSIKKAQFYLESVKGCSWKALSFDTGKPQGLDNFGMNNDEQSAREKLFYIRINKTKDGVKLEGIKGTGWHELNFKVKPNKNYRITASGVNPF